MKQTNCKFESKLLLITLQEFAEFTFSFSQRIILQIVGNQVKLFLMLREMIEVQILILRLPTLDLGLPLVLVSRGVVEVCQTQSSFPRPKLVSYL